MREFLVEEWKGGKVEKQPFNHSTGKQTNNKKEYMMNTAAGEWAARVAARNEIETAKARQAAGEQLTPPFGSGFDESGNIRLLPLNAEHPLTQEQIDLKNSPLGITLGLYQGRR